MEERQLKRNQRMLSVMIGIFLLLLSIALTLSIEYVMRTLVAPFIMFFGHAQYAIYLLMAFEGISLITRGKLTLYEAKWKHYIFALFVIFTLTLVSAIEIKTFPTTDIIRDFFVLYNHFDGGYYAPRFLNLFEVQFGGGLFGYLLAVPLSRLMGQDLTIVLTAILSGSMIIILYFKYIKSGISAFVGFIIRTAKKEPKPVKEKPKKKTKQEKLEEKYKYSFVEESDSLLHANEIGEDEVEQLNKPGEVSRLNFEDRKDAELPRNIFSSKPFSETGTIQKAKINLFGEQKEPVRHEPRTVYPVNEEEKNETPIKEEEKIDFVPQINNDDPQEEKVSYFEEHFKDEPLEIKDEKEEEIKVEPTPINQIITPKEEPITPSSKVDTPLNVTPITPEIKPEINQEVLNVEVKPEEIKKSDIEIKEASIEWTPPPTDQLITYQTDEQVQANIDKAKEELEIVNQAFRDFGVLAEVVNFVIGPSITRLLIDYPSTGSVKAVDKVKLDISRRLNGTPIRFAETVQGTPYSGFEVPNPIPSTVSFKEVFEALPPANQHPTAVAFGKDITGKVVFADIADFPHLLVSGTSGSGKSVFVNSLITTLIARTSPEDLKIILVDPKCVEMNKYKEEPHLFCPVINSANEAKVMLYKMVDFMNERYHIFEAANCSTNIKEYNRWATKNNQKTMPYIVIFLDEYSDLAYTCKEVSFPLVSICQKARAAGIHVVVSTQRPSTDVITGNIKANLQTRVSLTAASSTDSVTILDEGGAEDLLGNGDMLVKSPLVSRSGLARLQGCYLQGEEIFYIVSYLKERYKPQYHPDFMDLSEDTPESINPAFPAPNGEVGDSDEEKYNWIKEWAMTQDTVSMSKIQRDFSVGFNRAGRIVKRLQDDGILSTETEGSNKGYKVIQSIGRFNPAPDIGSDELLIKKDDKK